MVTDSITTAHQWERFKRACHDLGVDYNLMGDRIHIKNPSSDWLESYASVPEALAFLEGYWYKVHG